MINKSYACKDNVQSPKNACVLGGYDFDDINEIIYGTKIRRLNVYKTEVLYVKHISFGL